jgi:hypothetical protein
MLVIKVYGAQDVMTFVAVKRTPILVNVRPVPDGYLNRYQWIDLLLQHQFPAPQLAVSAPYGA